MRSRSRHQGYWSHGAGQEKFLPAVRPGAGVQVRTRIGVRAVRETPVAVIEVATRIRDAIIGLRAMPHVAIVGEAVAEHDDLRERWRRLGVNSGGSRSQRAKNS